MKVIGIIMVDLESSPLGTRSRLSDMLAGVPLLRRTLERAARATRMERRFVVVPAPQAGAVADLAAGLPVTLETYSGQSPAYRDLVTAGRLWGLDGWRGGVGGLCAFDEEVHVPAAAALAARENADVVVSIPAAAGMIDPGLIDALIDHYAREGHIFRMTFAQAPPGLAPIVLARTLLEELAPSGQPPGAVLTYKPGKPIPDLTGREACYRGATEIIEAGGRLLGDTRRSFDRLERMIHAIGPDGDALAASRWLRDADATFVADYPAEIEIELTSHDPWQGGSLLHPGTKDVPDRGSIDVELVRKAVEGCSAWDDVRVVLGGFGDPLAHPQFGEMVRMIRAAGAAAIAVRTSGLIRTREIDDAIFETPVDVLEVMLDAATPDGYRRVHGTDGFDAAMNCCGTWLQRRHENRRVRPLIVPSMVKANETLAEMEAFFDGWTERHGTALLTGYSHRAGQLADRSVVHMAPPQRVACRRTFSRTLVLADGSVTTCDQDFAGKQVPGNVSRDSISSIWRSEVMRRLRCDDRSLTMLCATCTEWHRP